MENGYLKQALVNSQRERIRKINEKEQVVVGVNEFTETEVSPLTSSDGGIESIDPNLELERISELQEWRKKRDANKVKIALQHLSKAASSKENIMQASIEAAKVGVTTGEWAKALRNTFGEFKAPTGISSGIQSK